MWYWLPLRNNGPLHDVFKLLTPGPYSKNGIPGHNYDTPWSNGVSIYLWHTEYSVRCVKLSYLLTDFKICWHKCQKMHARPRYPTPMSSIRCGRVVRWCWVNFQCRDVLLISIRVWQGPTALQWVRVGVLDIFSLVYHFSFLSPYLWETARYRLNYCLKGMLSPKQPTNLPIKIIEINKR